MRAFVVNMSDIRRCPKLSLSPGHYREDGSCKCPGDDSSEPEKEEQEQ